MSKFNARIFKGYLDYLWGTLVLYGSSTCQLCDEPAVDPHHIFCKKRTPPLRWNPHNGVSLCSSCHFLAHQNPMIVCDGLKAHLGIDLFENLLGFAVAHKGKGVSTKTYLLGTEEYVMWWPIGQLLAKECYIFNDIISNRHGWSTNKKREALKVVRKSFMEAK